MMLGDAEDNRRHGGMASREHHLAQSETPCTWRRTLTGTWEISAVPAVVAGRLCKA